MKIRSALGLLLLIALLATCKQPNLDTDRQPTVSTFIPGSAFPKAIQSATYMAIDAVDNLYLSDYYGNQIWKITPQGTFSIFAGSGKMGFRDGTAQNAQFYGPRALTFDSAGNLYVGQYAAIRKITPSGVVSTVYGAGVGGLGATPFTVYDTIRQPVYQGTALFNDPHSLVFDSAGNLFVGEGANTARLMRFTPTQQVSILLGQPFDNSANLTPKPSIYFFPDGLALDTQGNLFIADPGDGTLVRITAQGMVSYLTTQGYEDKPATYRPFKSSFDLSDVVIDKQNNIYICEDRYVEQVGTDGSVRTIAGSGKDSYVINGQPEAADVGVGSQVRLFGLHAPVIDSKGNLYVLEQAGIRKITF